MTLTEMKKPREFDSLDELVSGTESGFVIIHQERALGNDFRDKMEESDRARDRLTRHAREAQSQLQTILGEPTAANTGWDIGVPTWASGGEYALWKREKDFVAVFISWDNPEDPSFVIAAKAPVGDFNNDHINPPPDPWGSEWMFKGEW